MTEKTKREVEAQELFDQGLKYYSDNDFENSVNIFKQLLNEYSYETSNSKLNYWLGLSFFNQRQFDFALKHLQKAYMRFNKDQDGFYIMTVLCHLTVINSDLGNFDLALEYANTAENYVHCFLEKKMNDDIYGYRIEKGKLYHLLGLNKQAIEQYELAEKIITTDDVNKNSKHNEILFKIGRSYHYLEDDEKAFLYFNKVNIHSLDHENHHNYYVNYFKVLVNLKHYDDALKLFDKLKILGISDDFIPEVYHYAGRAFYFTGDYLNSKKYISLSEQYSYTEEWLEESNKQFLDVLNKAGY